MTTLNIQTLKNEIVHSLRNGDILSTTVRGVTTRTDNFTATAGQTQFTLTQTPVKNIRSLTVAAVAKYYLRDYTVAWSTGIVTLSTGATVGDAVAIQYDYGTGDKIYPDLPRDDLYLTSYPRVGLELTSITTTPLGLGGMVHMSDLLITIFAWMPANIDSAIASGTGGQTALSTLMYNIRNVIRTNAKTYYTFTFITPAGTGPLLKGEEDKLLMQSQDFQIRFVVE